jgi:solute carrier family 35 protein F5
MPASADAAWALGIVFIVLVAAFWAGSSVLTQFIFDNLSFNEPFVLTYIGTSLFMIFIPGWLTLSFFKCVDNPPYRRDPSVQVTTECCDSRYELVGLTADLPEDVENGGFSGEDGLLNDPEIVGAAMSSAQQLEEPIIESPALKKDDSGDRINLNSASQELPHSGMMSHLGTARVSLIVCPIWFIANW